MSEPEVSVFEWPSRFLVSTPNKDSEWRKFFKGLEDFVPYAPYLVDLDELEAGWCGCRDFAVNVAPYLDQPNHRRDCSHILAARRFKEKHKERPKPMPAILSLTRNQQKG